MALGITDYQYSWTSRAEFSAAAHTSEDCANVYAFDGPLADVCTSALILTIGQTVRTVDAKTHRARGVEAGQDRDRGARLD
jgi:hypothetical protein